MQTRIGIPVSPGVAICPAVILDAQEYRIQKRHILPDQRNSEIERFKQAAAASETEMAALRDRTSEAIGPETAAIFDFHLGMIRDPRLIEQATDHVNHRGYSAEYAVSTVLRHTAKALLTSSNSYLADRVKDVYDIEKRLLRHLAGETPESLTDLGSDVVVVAHDLTPSQTAQLDRKHVKGFATDAGGRTSHTAIVARAQGIPGVVGLNDITADVSAGDTVVIDGNTGAVIVDPDPATLAKYQAYERQFHEFEDGLVELRELPAETEDGTRITLLGNIEFPDEVATCMEKGCEGIGLYRTEFLFLSSETEPTEEEHYSAYRRAIEAVNGKPIIIRSLDLGADKYTQSRQQPERNPFLGCRSIRFCFENQALFKTQLRAILRASVLGDVRLMFPLITTLPELRRAKLILADVMEELEELDVDFNHRMPLGIMIETPSAALLASRLMQEVDFVSIGTNDLIQYTLAVDRANERVASLFTAADPAVIKLIRDIIRTGIRQEKEISLCGEMAGDPVFTVLLLGMGLQRFSSSPVSIPEIKKIIRSVTLRHARHVARRVVTFESSQQILNYLAKETRKVIPEAFVQGE